MSNMETIQELLKGKADIQAKLKVSVFDGNVEIKTINNEKYIYVRKGIN